MKKISTAATQRNGKVKGQGLTVGLDLGDRSSWYCVLNEAGDSGAVDQGEQAGGQDDAALLPSVSLEPSTAGAEPAGLQPGEFVAAAGVAPRDRELVAHQPAATTGEDRRTSGQTCALLLAIAGRRTSDAAAVRNDAGPDH